MENYNNLIEAINGLKKQGYTEDFNIQGECLECQRGYYKMFHNDFEIDKIYRFEGDGSSPDDSSILYAISSEKFKVKGTMINSYGIYSDAIADEMLAKLKFA